MFHFTERRRQNEEDVLLKAIEEEEAIELLRGPDPGVPTDGTSGYPSK